MSIQVKTGSNIAVYRLLQNIHTRYIYIDDCQIGKAKDVGTAHEHGIRNNRHKALEELLAFGQVIACICKVKNWC